MYSPPTVLYVVLPLLAGMATRQILVKQPPYGIFLIAWWGAKMLKLPHDFAGPACLIGTGIDTRRMTANADTLVWFPESKSRAAESANENNLLPERPDQHIACHKHVFDHAGIADGCGR